MFPSLMGTSGLEPPTSRLSGVRSNHLSYAPILNRSTRFKISSSNFWSQWDQILLRKTVEPRHSLSLWAIFGLVRSLTLSLWWRWGGSNSWPPACKAGALPAELHPHTSGTQVFLMHFQDTFLSLNRKSVPSKLNNKLHLTLVLTRLLKQTRKYYFEVNDLDFASQNHNISG